MTDYSTILIEQRLKADEEARLKMYKAHWELYNGKHKAMLPVRPGQPDDNVYLNLSRMIIDQGVEFLFGKSIEFELQEGEQTPEEEALDQNWQRNRRMTFLNEVGVTGGICGHVFLKLVPEPDIDGPEWVRLVNVQPEYVRVRYDD